MYICVQGCYLDKILNDTNGRSLFTTCFFVSSFSAVSLKFLEKQTMVHCRNHFILINSICQRHSPKHKYALRLHLNAKYWHILTENWITEKAFLSHPVIYLSWISCRISHTLGCMKSIFDLSTVTLIIIWVRMIRKKHFPIFSPPYCSMDP